MLKINLSVDVTELDAVELRVSVELVIDDTVPIKIYAHRLWADMGKAESLLGFKPSIDLRHGVEKIIQMNFAKT